MNYSIKVLLSSNKMLAQAEVVGEGPVSRDEIMEALAQKNICFGILEENIELLLEGPRNKVVTIARGIPPVSGEDGLAEIICGTGDKKVSQSDIVDFLETSLVLSVNEGELIAVKRPPILGTPGCTVTNEPFRPPVAREANLVAGKGVRIDQDTNRVYAIIKGRPVIKNQGISWVFSVDPTYDLTGDVNIQTGNIRFKGNVNISGTVLESMAVEAAGSVKVGGLVIGASVFCGESLVIEENLINSSVSVGLKYVDEKKIKLLLKDIYTDMVDMLKAIEQLKGKMPNMDKLAFFQIINLLKEKKFKPFEKKVKQVLSISAFNLPEEVASAVDLAKSLARANYSAEEFKNILMSLSGALNVLSEKGSQGATVRVGAASGSVIQCSGKVTITGQGCIDTKIIAGEDVKVSGVFRGGEILTEGNASIDCLGSTLGKAPLVRVGPGCYIKAGKIFPGVIVQIGSRRQSVARELISVMFKVDDNGDIVTA